MTMLEHDRPPILDVLPRELRRESAPEPCVCSHCAPQLSELQRAAHERVKHDWRTIRVAWCEAHGYQIVDLLQAELRQR
jgi:hypothetical protein